MTISTHTIQLTEEYRERLERLVEWYSYSDLDELLNAILANGAMRWERDAHADMYELIQSDVRRLFDPNNREIGQSDGPKGRGDFDDDIPF